MISRETTLYIELAVGWSYIEFKREIRIIERSGVSCSFLRDHKS